MAHHPEKFLDGRMLWRGRIYSPLPFVRSLWGRRINAGVWGTAAFPSVYRTDVHPFAFLPHSVRWQVLSIVARARRGWSSPRLGGHEWAAALLLGSRRRRHRRDDRQERRLRAALGRRLRCAGNRLWYRATVAYLHFIQPFARMRGRIRGMLSPPEVALPIGRAADQPRAAAVAARSVARAAAALAAGVTEDRYWSETWTTTDRVLTQLTDWLRRSRAVRTIEIDDGWSDDRDVSVLVGRWAWLDVRALVEEHGCGKGLLRVSTHLRPTSFGVVSGVGAGAGAARRRRRRGAALAAGRRATAALALAIIGFAAWRTAQATAIVRRAVEPRRPLAQDMMAMKSGPARVPLIAPSLLRVYGLRTALCSW